MRKTILFLLFITFILLNISGCWFLVGGAAGVAGAYAVSKDTMQIDTDKPYDSIWNAAQAVARIRGTIKSEDYTKGAIELEADSSQVWIRLIKLTHATTRLRVSARKKHFPNLTLAEEIFSKIMEETR